MKDSPPLRLFMDPNATPVAIHSPAAVPRHWEDSVKAGLERDIRLGVIERVPVNTPTGPEKHREHGSSAPRKVDICQEV